MAVEAERPQAVSRTLHPARRLGAVERARLAAEILATYFQVRRLMRSAPIVSVVAILRSGGPAASATMTASESTLGHARRLGAAVARALAFVPGDTRCLIRSLVLIRLMSRRDLSSKLVIGARAAPDFLAHAWVEHLGNPVLSPGDASFSRLVEL